MALYAATNTHTKAGAPCHVGSSKSIQLLCYGFSRTSWVESLILEDYSIPPPFSGLFFSFRLKINQESASYRRRAVQLLSHRASLLSLTTATLLVVDWRQSRDFARVVLSYRTGTRLGVHVACHARLTFNTGGLPVRPVQVISVSFPGEKLWVPP